MAYRIVAKSPKHLNDIVEDIMSWFETAREYRTQFDTESIKFADPVTKQVSGFRDIDVLHVQDITTGKKTVIKLIPLIRPEEMKIVMGGENEHVMKGKIKNMMKGRGEFKTYNKDTLRKMESKMKISEFKKMIREEVRNVLREKKKKTINESSDSKLYKFIVGSDSNDAVYRRDIEDGYEKMPQSLKNEWDNLMDSLSGASNAIDHMSELEFYVQNKKYFSNRLVSMAQDILSDL